MDFSPVPEPDLVLGGVNIDIYPRGIEIQKQDKRWMSTVKKNIPVSLLDGVRDQFGGPHNRKLGRKRLADLLQEHAHLPMGERERSIQQALLMWKGGNAKVDDATLVGIDIPFPQED